MDLVAIGHHAAVVIVNIPDHVFLLDLVEDAVQADDGAMTADARQAFQGIARHFTVDILDRLEQGAF